MRIRSQALLYSCSRVIPAAVNFVFLLLAVRLLSSDDLGYFVIATAGGAILYAGGFGWIDKSIVRNFPLDPNEVSKYISAIRTFTLIPISLSFVFIPLLSHPSTELVALVLMISTTEHFSNSTLELERMKENHVTYFLNILFRSLILMFCIACSYSVFGSVSYMHFVLSLVSSRFAASFITSDKILSIWLKLDFETKVLRNALEFGWPLSIGGLLKMSSKKLDRFVVAFFLGVEAAGVYGSAVDIIFRVFNIICGIPHTIFYPKIVSAYESNSKEFRKYFFSNFAFTVLVCCLTAFSFLLASEFLWSVIYKNHTYDFALIVMICGFVSLGLVWSLHYELCLILLRKTKHHMLFNLLVIIFVSTISVISAPLYGFYGVAAAQYFGFIVAFVLFNFGNYGLKIDSLSISPAARKFTMIASSMTFAVYLLTIFSVSFLDFSLLIETAVEQIFFYSLLSAALFSLTKIFKRIYDE